MSPLELKEAMPWVRGVPMAEMTCLSRADLRAGKLTGLGRRARRVAAEVYWSFLVVYVIRRLSRFSRFPFIATSEFFYAHVVP
jgi:hypothetical protein